MPGKLLSSGLRLRRTTGRAPARVLSALAILLPAAWEQEAGAVERIVLDVGELSVAGTRISGVSASLDLAASPAPAARVQASRVRLGKLLGTYSQAELACTDLVIKDPDFGCGQATLSAQGGPTGSVAVRGSAGYNTGSRTFSLAAAGLAIAGGVARLTGTIGPGKWTLNADAAAIDLVKARTLAEGWVHVPAEYSVKGHIEGHAEMAGQSGRVQLRVTTRTEDLNLANRDGTVVAENVTASLGGTLTHSGTETTVDADLASSRGQTLAGPVLFDFAANPLSLHGQMSYDGTQTLQLSGVRISQKDLLEAQGQGEVRLGSAASLTRAHVDVQHLTFPAAYRSFLRLELAATAFGALRSTGSASGAFDIADNGITRLDARLDGIELVDPNSKLSLTNVTGDLHWAADRAATVGSSHLAWSGGSVYGLRTGAVQLTFTARERSFTLQGDTRLPIFDGALVIHTLSGRRLGTARAEVEFDADVEPISMSLLSKAFGWPELSGRLAGRIPGVRYRDRVLETDGDLVANVFDGTITGSHFRLVDPLGPWPRLFADVTARGLDLDLVTHTFAIGSITGRLNADVQGLELFKWSPVAFDARLYTTPGDRSKHLISQKAVSSISSIGGGGGPVVAALQSGVLKFFDRFHYDRIGISCRLNNEVCLMSGIEPARTGYYLVKGSGLPRIDIIGNSGRVNWPQLVAQIVAGMRSQSFVVK